MRFLIALCLVLNAQSQSLDCGKTFLLEQEGFIALNPFVPASAAPGIFTGLWAYASGIQPGKPEIVRLRVFNAQKWNPPETTRMKDGAFSHLAKTQGLKLWTASVRTLNDRVGFFAYEAPFHLEVVRVLPKGKQRANDTVELRICRP
jgi:hypothetical protein